MIIIESLTHGEIKTEEKVTNNEGETSGKETHVCARKYTVTIVKPEQDHIDISCAASIPGIKELNVDKDVKKSNDKVKIETGNEEANELTKDKLKDINVEESEGINLDLVNLSCNAYCKAEESKEKETN